MEAAIWNKRGWVEETDPETLIKHYQWELGKADFDILGFMQYQFEPFGFSALWLLGESHFAVHTFPEENTTYVELSSCIKIKYDTFVRNNPQIK
jgi:S-adenosylmethionine/arginine decarboxylase-like enzyme